jgi:hypothetical protein
MSPTIATSQVLIRIVTLQYVNRTWAAQSEQVTNVAKLPASSCRINRNERYCLPPIPIQIAAIAVQVAVVMPQFPSFTTGSPVISTVPIAPEFPALMRNLRPVAPDIAPIPPAIRGKHRSRAHSDQQYNPRYHAFHIPFSLRSQFFDLQSIAAWKPLLQHANTPPAAKFRAPAHAGERSQPELRVGAVRERK